MYKIEKKLYGIKIIMEGYMLEEEAKKWKEELIKTVDTIGFKDYGIFVDMRNLKPLPEASQKHIETGQRHCRNIGMLRSVVILNDAVTTLQFKRIAKDTGIDKKERYINATQNKDWEQVGLDWIRKGIEPIETY